VISNNSRTGLATTIRLFQRRRRRCLR
jgi:hypothetical protein